LNKSYLINDEITSKIIRISGEKDTMSLEDALNRANEEEVDLIQIAESNGTSICILESLSKYLYKQKKHEKEISKNKTKTSIKEIKLGLNIGDHDMNHKAKRAIEIMDDGDKVKVSLFLSGREILRSEEGISTVKKFIEKCMPCTYDKEIKLDGKIISAVIFKK
jgi:translation initiation factor IF-3